MMSRFSEPPDFDSFEWDNEDEPPREESAVPPAPTAPAPGESPPPPASPALPRRRALRRESDPVFLYAVLVAFSVGLMPLAEGNPIERYTILWTLLAIVGVAGILLRGRPLLSEVKAADLLWGAGFGFLLGTPLLLVGAGILALASDKIFAGLPDGAVFQSLVFVMSTAETLFFREVLQEVQPWLVTALMSSGWSILMFFPAVAGYLYPALVISTFIVMLSVLYSYVRQRNGLAAAWVCQIVVSVLWLFVPRLLA
jgi:hypothetical protein